MLPERLFFYILHCSQFLINLKVNYKSNFTSIWKRWSSTGTKKFFSIGGGLMSSSPTEEDTENTALIETLNLNAYIFTVFNLFGCCWFFTKQSFPQNTKTIIDLFVQKAIPGCYFLSVVKQSKDSQMRFLAYIICCFNCTA